MNLLEIRKISKIYQITEGEKIALDNLSLDIKKGEIFGLLGVNGAGKSTLSGIIATLHPATSGDILYKNKSIYDDITEFRLKLGYCPQSPNLNSSLTLYENLFYAGKLYGLPSSQIELTINKLVKQFDLEKYLNEKASILSGGYKQRFMIARSLIHNPEIIILDEPTVGLDPHIRRSLWDVIKDLKNYGITVILTTHYLDEAEKLSDRICILDYGKIKLIDTPQNLISSLQKSNLEDAFIEIIKQDRELL